MAKISREQSKEICKRYVNGDAGSHIAFDYNVSPPTIYNTLRNSGIEIRDSRNNHRKHSLDINAFDNLENDPEGLKAYWLGFLMADGAITRTGKNGYIVSLGLSESDGEHLECLKLFLETSAPIFNVRGRKDDKWHKSKRLSVCSTDLAESISRYGITTRKSITSKCSIELANNPDFFRGVIDGDGWIVMEKGKRQDGSIRRYPIIGLCGSRSICKQFLDFVMPFAPNFTGSVRRYTSANCYRVGLSGCSAVAVIKALGYQDDKIALVRKKLSALECLEWIPERPMRIRK